MSGRRWENSPSLLFAQGRQRKGDEILLGEKKSNTLRRKGVF